MLHLIHQPHKQGAATISSALDEKRLMNASICFICYENLEMLYLLKFRLGFFCPVFQLHAIKKLFVLFIQGVSKHFNDVNREKVLGKMQSSQPNNPIEVSYVLLEKDCCAF